MADQEPIEQLTLYPTRGTLKEVIQEGLSQLPINNPNELVALLHLHHNTVINLMSKQEEPCQSQ